MNLDKIDDRESLAYMEMYKLKSSDCSININFVDVKELRNKAVICHNACQNDSVKEFIVWFFDLEGDERLK